MTTSIHCTQSFSPTSRCSDGLTTCLTDPACSPTVRVKPGSDAEPPGHTLTLTHPMRPLSKFVGQLQAFSFHNS